MSSILASGLESPVPASAKNSGAPMSPQRLAELRPELEEKE
ncbi:hypothetical protein [Streptomyces inhibens]|nr:hypothetical protein [Streptomyces inhibens]